MLHFSLLYHFCPQFILVSCETSEFQVTSITFSFISFYWCHFYFHPLEHCLSRQKNYGYKTDIEDHQSFSRVLSFVVGVFNFKSRDHFSASDRGNIETLLNDNTSFSSYYLDINLIGL